MSEKKVVITGINGFVGEHLAREFHEQGYSVTGIGHDSEANTKVASLLESYVSCDLLDEGQVNERLNLSNTKAVVHLAGLANVGESFDQPKRYMTNNGIMTHNLLSKALSDSQSGRVVVVSTGALYDPRQPLPLTEESKTASNSPYAVGKLMCEDVVEYYRGRGVDSVTVRPFNHIGPGQAPGFILPDLYEKIQGARGTKEITVGNLETKRDYTDVRDIVRAYSKLALAESLQHEVYNVCSGNSYSGKEIFELLCKTLGRSDVSFEVDLSLVRPSDIPEIIGDAGRLQAELDWRPEVAIEQTIRDFVKSQNS